MKERKSILDPHREKLTEWFAVEKITLVQAQQRLAALGCAVSHGRLSSWWERQQQQRATELLLHRVASGADTNRKLEAQFAKDAAPETETLIKLLKMMVLQLSVQGGTDPDLLQMVPVLLGRVLEKEKIDITREQVAQRERQIALLEKKAELAEKARAVTDSPLSPDEKAAQMKSIFGIA